MHEKVYRVKGPVDLGPDYDPGHISLWSKNLDSRRHQNSIDVVTNLPLKLVTSDNRGVSNVGYP